MPKQKKSTSADRPIVHLICQAHIDPVWMWNWQEGAREGISTFHTAASLLEEFPGFIFNHNESVLYEWIEENDPALFARIRKLVKQGRWNIAGGWYVQPDCNMPAGETLVRQIMEGRRYFADKFGVWPTVAYNFDSFGHPASFPQVLQQAGYGLYIHCRPVPHQLELPAALRWWEGHDGTQVLALRPDTGWYCTGPAGVPGIATARQQAENGIAQARETGRDALVLWGLGDHGGGPTRADLIELQQLIDETKDVDVRHSTPEAYLERITKQLDPESIPVHTGELQRTFAGCYTSVSKIKRAMRRAESMLASAERWAAIAWWRAGIPYPDRKLRRAWKATLFNTFHDTLCGSLAELAEPGVMDYFGYANHIAGEIIFKSQNALTPATPPEPGSVPLFVFNPHPYPIQAPVGLHFVMDYRPAPGLHPFDLYDDAGQIVPSQTGGGQFEQSSGGFQPHIQFIADVPPLTARRYEVRPAVDPRRGGETRAQSLQVTQTARRIVVENWWWRATFDKTSAALVSLVELASGREMLRGPARLVAMRDTGDAWGGDTNADFNTPVGEFTALTPEQVGAQWAGEDGATGSPLRVLPAKEELLMGGGRPVSVTVEGLTGWRRSQASIQITLYADLPWIDVNTRLHMQERRKMIKLVLPFRLAHPQVTCEVPYGIAARAADGSEHVQNRWVRLDETTSETAGKGRGRKKAAAKAGEPRSVVVANNGIYGFAVTADGTLGLSLARGAVHTRWGDQPIEPDEHHTFIDQGQVDTRFRILIGEPEAVTQTLWPAALELNQPLDAFAVFYPPTPQIDPDQAARPFLRVEPATVQLGALKKAEDEDALIIRLVESAGKATTATLTLEGMDAPHPVTLAPFEIVTLKATRRRRGVVIKPCSLLET